MHEKTSTISHSVFFKNGILYKNRRKIKIVGTKVWEDNEDFAKKRPESVILQLKVGENIISEA